MTALPQQRLQLRCLFVYETSFKHFLDTNSQALKTTVYIVELCALQEKIKTKALLKRHIKVKSYILL